MGRFSGVRAGACAARAHASSHPNRHLLAPCCRTTRTTYRHATLLMTGRYVHAVDMAWSMQPVWRQALLRQVMPRVGRVAMLLATLPLHRGPTWTRSCTAALHRPSRIHPREEGRWLAPFWCSSSLQQVPPALAMKWHRPHQPCARFLHETQGSSSPRKSVNLWACQVPRATSVQRVLDGLPRARLVRLAPELWALPEPALLAECVQREDLRPLLARARLQLPVGGPPPRARALAASHRGAQRTRPPSLPHAWHRRARSWAATRGSASC